MKRFFFIFFVLSNCISITSKSQAPDLSKISNYKQKVKAWSAYCADLRLNKNGAKDNYIILQQAGLKGLTIVRPNDDSAKASFFLFTALGVYYQLKFDSAQYYFYQSLYSAQKASDTKLIAAASEALMSINFQLQQPGKVDSCKNILEAIADTTKDRAILQDIYSAFGSYYQQKSYYSTAQDYYIKSIQLREKVVDTTQNDKAKFDYAIQCDQLSKLYLNTQMADKSLASLRKGKRFADVSPVVSNRLLSSFVEAFTTSNNIDSALFYYNQLVTHSKNHPEFSSELVSSNLNIGIFYIDHKEYNKALSYINKGDSLATAIKSPFLIFQAQMIEGRYFEETGSYEKAISLLNQASPVAVQLSKELYSNILKYLALSYKGMGNVKNALQYYEQYVQVQDTVNKEKISRTFADLETRYQTNEKQNQIVSLDQKNKLNILELKQASNTKTLMILGLISLGIFSLLLYFIYRNKEKLNKVLNDRNTQLDTLNHQLGVANDTKAKLFGIIGHDLRSPVSRIVQMLKIQKEKPELLSEDSRKHHEENLKIASENVLETMEDLLLWSKSQMQHFKPEFRNVLITEVVEKESSFLKDHADSKSILIKNEVPGRFTLKTDENFLEIIIRNLLQNAVKYSCDGTTISITSKNSNRISINNKIADVNQKNLDAILQNKSVTTKSDGLGLQIAKDLSSAIGAKIIFDLQENNNLETSIVWENT
ncbi:MAG: HAMP domain-containing sensor histidine kinase [Ginsengibacter sp.]